MSTQLKYNRQTMRIQCCVCGSRAATPSCVRRRRRVTTSLSPKLHRSSRLAHTRTLNPSFSSRARVARRVASAAKWTDAGSEQRYSCSTMMHLPAHSSAHFSSVIEIARAASVCFYGAFDPLLGGYCGGESECKRGRRSASAPLIAYKLD